MKKFITLILVALSALFALFAAATEVGATNDPYSGCKLELAKTADKTNVKAGDTISYRVEVRNTGTGVCSGGGIRLLDHLDSNVTYVTGSESHGNEVYTGTKKGEQNNVLSGSTLQWNLDVINPGEMKWVEFSVRVNNTNSCGNFEVNNQAKATAWQYNEFNDYAYSNTVKTTVTGDVSPTVEITNTPAAAIVGQVYNFTPTINTAGTVSTTTYSIENLPTGLTFNSTTGAVSGTPTAEGTFKITVQVEGTCGNDGDVISITVDAAPDVCAGKNVTTAFTNSPTTGKVGQAYNYNPTVTTTGPATLFGYSVNTTIAGLTFDANTGSITGTPTAAGTMVLTKTAGNDCFTATDTVTITIETDNTVCQTPAPTLTITSGNKIYTRGATVNYAITTSFTNDVDNTVEVTVTNLPAGLSYDSATGVISGTTTAAGTATITAKVSNDCGSEVVKTATITVNNPTTSGGGGGSKGSPSFSAVCKVSDKTVNVGEKVTFEADVKRGESPFEYTWSGDIKGDDEKETVTFDKAGKYEIDLLVEDDDGRKRRDDCTVTVRDNGEVKGTDTDVYVSETPFTVTEEYIYLTQVPYTGAGDVVKIIFFLLLASLVSAALAYSTLPAHKQVEVRNWFYSTFPVFFPGYAVVSTNNVIDYSFVNRFND